MTSEPDGLLILKLWSSEKVPCSVSIASSNFSLSAFGQLRYSSTELSLNWPNGSLGLADLEFVEREDFETVCTLVFRLRLDIDHPESGYAEVRILQKPEASEKVIN
jgi:hypothetical protein